MRAGTPDSIPSASLSVCMSSCLTICLMCSSQSAQPGALPSAVLVSFPTVFLTFLSGEPSRAGAGQLAPVVACPALMPVPASPASPASFLSSAVNGQSVCASDHREAHSVAPRDGEAGFVSGSAMGIDAGSPAGRQLTASPVSGLDQPGGGACSPFRHPLRWRSRPCVCLCHGY